VHGTGVYSAGVGPKGPALERFLDIKKKSDPSVKVGLSTLQFTFREKVKYWRTEIDKLFFANALN
jgi:hypothetical protein